MIFRRAQAVIFLIMAAAAAGICPAPLAALDYTDAYTAVTDVFASLADDDEGLTSFRSLNIPMGGRVEALGTAYTGLADDIGYIDYNPAGSSVLDKTEIAFFHNAWIADSAVETLAWTTRLNNLGLGAAIKCFYVPFTEYNIFGERVSSGYYSETSAAFNMSYNFLAGYDFKGIAAGFTVKGAYRGVPDYADNETNTIIKDSGLNQSGAAVMADAGVLFRFNAAKFFASREPNVRIGIAANNFGVAFTSFADGGELDDPLPARFSAGVSYKPARPVTITAEYRQPFDVINGRFYQGWSAAMGVAVAVTSFFDAQAGFLLQGANPRASLGASFAVRKFIVSANYTLDLASAVAPLNRFSLCAKLDLGDRGRAELRRRVDEYYAAGLRAYSEERLEEAAANWKECLRLDPKFDPARIAFAAVQTAILLRGRIIDIQTLD